MSSKQIAVLDLGTNTFHLLIADVFEDAFTKLVEEQRHAKLGEGGINSGYITEAAFKRGIDALIDFKSIIDKYKVNHIKATGTAALRSAKNGPDFISQVKDKTGIEVAIIEGDLEAELIYKGVRASIDLVESSLIMDIGGGSVEFIFCNNNNIFWKKSFPIGAAKLMAQYHHSDPISADNIAAVNQHLEHILHELKNKIDEFKPVKFVGSAGAFETFAALVAEKFNLDEKLLEDKTFSFDLANLKSVLEDIILSNHRQREQNKLIIPVRTDMIVVASVLTVYVLSLLDDVQLYMSRYALKEGLLFSVVE